MSFVPVVIYLAGLAVFGFFYWLMDNIINVFRGMGIADTTTYPNVLPTMMYIWYGITVLYLLLGGIWLIRTYNEKRNMRGML